MTDSKQAKAWRQYGAFIVVSREYLESPLIDSHNRWYEKTLIYKLVFLQLSLQNLNVNSRIRSLTKLLSHLHGINHSWFYTYIPHFVVEFTK